MEAHNDQVLCYKFSGNKKVFMYKSREALKARTKFGPSRAHLQVGLGWLTDDKEILKLRDQYGTSVAHLQACQGWITNDKEILKLCDEYKISVAHEQAFRGWTTEDPEILALATKDGLTVVEIQAERSGWEPEEEVKVRFIQELQKSFPEEKVQEILCNIDKLRKKYFEKILLGR